MPVTAHRFTPSIASPTTAKKEERKASPDNVNWKGRFVLVVAIGVGAIALGIAVYEMALLVYEIAHDKIWTPNFVELENSVKQKFSESIVDRFKQLKNLDTTRLFKRLAICKEEEREIISSLVDKFHLTDHQLQEIFMGAHVRLDDNGQLYDEWVKKIPDASKKSRISSHPSNAKQYGVRGPLVKELLFSRIKEGEKDYTWFQLENHPVSFGHIIRHMIDFFKYRLTGMQQGPDGSSKATHFKPLVILSKESNA